MIRGLIGSDLGPELILDLGSALAEESAQVAVGWSGGAGAEALAWPPVAGVTARRRLGGGPRRRKSRSGGLAG